MNFQLTSDYIQHYCTLTLLQICFAKLLIEKKKPSVMLETGLCSRKGIQYLHFFSNRYYFACDAVYSLTYFLNQEQTVEVTLITDFQILCSTASVRQK